MTSDERRHRGFEYRGVLAAWVNDVSSTPRIEQWPSLEIDAALERDFAAFFDTMEQVGLDYIVVAGLLVSWCWKPRFSESVSPLRADAVRRILAEARKRRIKVLYGLGLYSWGFDEIIRSDPDVRGTNPHAMCGSKAASHAVMEELVQYLASTFRFDGFHFESADLGRCECETCSARTDSQYHLELNERMAKYVRSRWPEMIVKVFCPIGKGSKDDWLPWGKASEHFSFLIDGNDRATRYGWESRRDIIASLRCAYGSRGGTWVYPPQRWDRLRWFIPIVEKRAAHYRRLAEDGGRAIAVQGAPLVNPAEEATLRCSGALASDPSRSARSVLLDAVEEMFRPRAASVADELADIFWSAEKAYWCNANFHPEGGELLLEPLWGKAAGPPVYLQTRMYGHDLSEYEAAMQDVRTRFLRIRHDLADKDRAQRVVTCLDAVLLDISAVKAGNSMLRYPASTTGPDSWTDEYLC